MFPDPNQGAPGVRSILKAQDGLTRFGFYLGTAALGLIVIIYAFEVTSRYLFNAPTLWGSDFVSFLLLISVFSTAPWLSRENGHVAVTILPDFLSPRGRLILSRAVFLVTALVCLWAGWIGFGENLYLFRRGTTTLTTIQIPKWILTAFITYGLVNSGLYFLRLLFGIDPQGDSNA